MKLLNSIFITCSVLLLFACSPQDDPDTQALDAYLSEKFAMHISDTTIYCFIPSNQCRNCFRYDGAQLSQAMNRRLIVISGFPASNFPHFVHVYADPDNAMLRLRLLNYGNRLLLCSNHRICGNVAITDLYSQLDSLEKTMSILKP